MNPFQMLRAVTVGAAALLALSSPLRAQESGASPTQSKTRSVAFIADSIAYAGDTARAVEMLEAAVRSNKRDGSSWHQLGLLLWNQVKSQRSGGFVRDPKAVRLMAAADSSLRLATQMEPDSSRFWISLSQFNASSGLASTTFSSGGQASSALAAAEKGGDELQVAIAADAAGVAAWRRYEPTAKRALSSDGRQVDLTALQGMDRNNAGDYLDQFVTPYYRARGIDLADPEQFAKTVNLRQFEAQFKGNPEVRVIINENDPLLSGEDLQWLRSTFRNEQLRRFPTGGHLGNLSQTVVQREVVRALADLLPSANY